VFLLDNGAVVGVVTERPPYSAPVWEKQFGKTDYTVLAQSGLTHATPIDHIIFEITRFTTMDNQQLTQVAMTPSLMAAIYGGNERTGDGPTR
jgi:hypothetical protein